MNNEAEYWKQLAMGYDEIYRNSFRELTECWKRSWRLETKVIRWQLISLLLFVILFVEILYLILN